MSCGLFLGVALLAVVGASPAFAQSGGAVAPSFDCGRAASPGERMVCADTLLAGQDRTLGDAYARDLAFARDPAALRAQERAALAVRNACTSRACLAAWYASRQAALDTAFEPAVGACAQTTVRSSGPRFEGVPAIGSAILYANGIPQVSYDVVPAITASRPGDPVRMCVVKRPQHCPPGDDRGMVYAAQNLRTGGRWRAADSQHMCGGA